MTEGKGPFTAKKAGEFLLDLFFPQRCSWCGKVVGWLDCDQCEEQLANLALPDKPIEYREFGWSLEEVSEVYACFLYKSPVKDAVKTFKFQENTVLARPLGQQVADKYLCCKLWEKYDRIIPVPVSAKTLKERGYNQSVLLAKEVWQAIREKAPVLYDDSSLIKVVETRHQRSLDKQERKTNLAGAFCVVDEKQVAGQRILLLDDVATTGSTLEECAKTLLAAGAKTCGGLCLAVTSPQE